MFKQPCRPTGITLLRHMAQEASRGALPTPDAPVPTVVADRPAWWNAVQRGSTHIVKWVRLAGGGTSTTTRQPVRATPESSLR